LGTEERKEEEHGRRTGKKEKGRKKKADDWSPNEVGSQSSAHV
jgi:hypothetical protein